VTLVGCDRGMLALFGPGMLALFGPGMLALFGHCVIPFAKTPWAMFVDTGALRSGFTYG